MRSPKSRLRRVHASTTRAFSVPATHGLGKEHVVQLGDTDLPSITQNQQGFEVRFRKRFDALEDAGGVDLVFDVIGGDIQKRSAGLVRAGGTLVSVVGPAEARPADGLAVDFVVESDRAQLGEIVRRVRDGRLRANIGNIATLDDAVAALNPTGRRKGKTIISVCP